MTKRDNKLLVNPGYALDQLRRALESTGETAASRVKQWRSVLAGMFEGTLSHGSRTPVEDAPAWVTLQVAYGGFATGRFKAAGPLLPHEINKLHLIDRPSGVSERAALNAYYLSDDGRAELSKLLETGCYRITVPEEAALIATTWLFDQGWTVNAERVLKEISPFFDRLRFYPVPADHPTPSGDGVYVQSAADVVKTLRSKKLNQRVETMKEAIRVWTPLYDRAVELFVETVEGETPRLATSKSGELVRQENGQPIVEGGWPCRRFSDGWAERARSLVEQYEEDRRVHTLSRKPEKSKENFARLRGYLNQCAENPQALSGRDVGMIRKILASYVTKHGAPDSERLKITRAVQARNASLPSQKSLALVLAKRIESRGVEGGLPNVAECVVPLTVEEAATVHAEPDTAFPQALVVKASKCLEAPIETLVAQGIVHSSETVATLLPRITAHTMASAIEQPELRRLYESVYVAFRQRRSLLLLDLETQIRLDELPWIDAVAPWVGSDEESRSSARAVMARTTRLVIEAFPQTILTNKLVQELRALASAAGARMPLVNELAADIFMDDFSESYLRSAHAAVPVLAGSLYERYYGLPLDRFAMLNDIDKERYGTPSSPGFAALCIELAGAKGHNRWSVARNGTIIEQAQILTTHNLAQLISGLDLLGEFRPVFPELARRCFEWICARQQLLIRDWQAEMQNVKNSAYAWRQMIFYLSMADEDELTRFLNWADEYLAKQREDFRDRFLPVIGGLHLAAAGGKFDSAGLDRESGSRRFLGWTLGRHWLLPERREALTTLR